MYILFTIAIIIILYFTIGILSSRKLRIRRFTIPVSDIEIKGFKIVLLSDLHGRRIEGLENSILSQNPNLIVFAGDMIDAYEENADIACEFAEKLADNAKVIAVRGNHFYKANKCVQTQMEETFDKFGIISLKNQRHIISHKSSKIAIDGIDDPIAVVGYKDIKRNEMLKRNDGVAENSIKKLNNEKNESVLKIAVCHRPSYAHHFQKAGYSLLLSGHTHGGQLALPFGTEIIGDEAKLFPKKGMKSGLNFHEKMPLVITSGIGYSNVKIRTFMPHEIVVITFD